MAEIQKDQALQWVDYEAIAAQVPQDIYYQNTAANTYSTGGYSFYVITPASNALLDNEIYIEIPITINLSGYAGGLESTNNSTPFAASNTHFALRQCWAIARSIQNLSVNINGTVISNSPVVWMDAMNRLYLSEEEASNICTMSGGEFDTGYRLAFGEDMNPFISDANQTLTGAQTMGFKINRGFGSNTTTLGSQSHQNDADEKIALLPVMPANSMFENQGFSRRFYRIVKLLREQINSQLTPGQNRYGTGSFTFSLFERVPIAPFLLYDSRDYKMSIPHVRTLTLTASYSTNAGPLVWQYPKSNVAPQQDLINSTLNINVPALTWMTNQPILHLKWIMSKDIIPPNISIPCSIIREYQLGFSTPVFATTSPTISSTGQQYNNINLEGVPDLLLIYLRKDPNNAAYGDPSEHFLGIDLLNITVAGTTGKMNNISRGELYSLWLKNVVHRGIYKQSFQEWYTRGCVVALRPKDYGCMFGPGMDYPVQISVSVNYTNWNVFPQYLESFTYVVDNTATTTSYNFYIVAVYNRYSLSLNSGGGSKLSLLKIPLVNDAIMGSAPMKPAV